MGAGIAQTAICSGFEVILNDVGMELLERSRAGIAKNLAKRVAKGRMTVEESAAALCRLTLADSLEAAAEADLVIEAVVERAQVKKSIFSALSSICREDAILATNTSSISIAELASAVFNPARFLGMHFFSPVPVMKLLEIVRGLSTGQEAVEAARAVGERLGKRCIVAKDRPGFIVNRMVDPMINEAISLLDQGVGTVEDIDNGMKLGLNHPMGPLELIDMVGIDVELAVMEVLYAETGDPKYRPALLLRDMVRLNWLGRKTGKGFYLYHEDGTRETNPALL